MVNDREVLGRPVEVQVMQDGSLLVSDDFANAIIGSVIRENRFEGFERF